MTRGSRKLVAVALRSIVLSSCLLRAQDFVPATQIKGSKDTEIWAGGVAAQHDGTTAFNLDIWMGGVRFGRVLTAPHGSGWLRGTLQWDVDAIPLFVVTNLQTAYGAELDPIVGRWNFQHKGRTAPYFEMSGGVVYTNVKIPPPSQYTSRFNIVPKFGFGWQLFRNRQRCLDVGVNAWHFSNVWTEPRNPSANGIQLTLGYHWYGLRKMADRKPGK